jgi:hypothetical protein
MSRIYTCFAPRPFEERAEQQTVPWEVHDAAIGLEQSASSAHLSDQIAIYRWTATMSEALVVSIPHRLGKQEAVRRLRTGLENARSNYARFLAIEEEIWDGDSVQFRVRALGQTANGKVDVLDDHVRLEVMLPWLLAKFAETIAPALRKEGKLLLEKK